MKNNHCVKHIFTNGMHTLNDIVLVMWCKNFCYLLTVMSSNADISMSF